MKNNVYQSMKRFWTIIGIVGIVTGVIFCLAQLYVVAAWAGLIGLLGYLGETLNQYFLDKIKGTYTTKTDKDKILSALSTISYIPFALFLVVVIATNNDKNNIYYILSETVWISFCLIWVAYRITTMAISYFRKNNKQ